MKEACDIMITQVPTSPECQVTADGLEGEDAFICSLRQKDTSNHG
jgi:hypothetical protein